jgi:hypothetical protein
VFVYEIKDNDPESSLSNDKKLLKVRANDCNWTVTDILISPKSE